MTAQTLSLTERLKDIPNPKGRGPWLLALGVAVALLGGALTWLLLMKNDTRIVDSIEPPFITTIDTLPPHKPDRPKPRPKVAVHTIDKPDTPVLPILVDKTDPQPLQKTDTPPEGLGGKANPTPNTDSGPDTGALVEGAQWRAFPDAATLADDYPPKALEAEIGGRVSLDCELIDTTGRVRCQIASENPKGYGFAAATKSMVERVGRIDMHDPRLRLGSHISVSVRWNPPPQG